MVFKFTKLNINDTCGFLIGKCFHIYNRKFIKNSGYSYISIKKTYKKQSHRVGSKKKSYVIKIKKTSSRVDSTFILFKNNSSVVIKKRLSILGKFTRGPLPYSIKRSKLLSSFILIIICLTLQKINLYYFICLLCTL